MIACVAFAIIGYFVSHFMIGKFNYATPGRLGNYEGVESEEQMAALTEVGCDFLQGYYYSKPVCEEEFLAFVAKFNII